MQNLLLLHRQPFDRIHYRTQDIFRMPLRFREFDLRFIQFFFSDGHFLPLQMRFKIPWVDVCIVLEQVLNQLELAFGSGDVLRCVPNSARSNGSIGQISSTGDVECTCNLNRTWTKPSTLTSAVRQLSSGADGDTLFVIRRLTSSILDANAACHQTTLSLQRLKIAKGEAMRSPHLAQKHSCGVPVEDQLGTMLKENLCGRVVPSTETQL